MLGQSHVIFTSYEIAVSKRLIAEQSTSMVGKLAFESHDIVAVLKTLLPPYVQVLTVDNASKIKPKRLTALSPPCARPQEDGFYIQNLEQPLNILKFIHPKGPCTNSTNVPHLHKLVHKFDVLVSR
ncbi:hypothetical protein LguiB_016742 [Lonicera macranthoides]